MQAVVMVSLMTIAAGAGFAAQDVVVGPQSGGTDESLQAAINTVIKAGGGRVLIKPGTYVLHRGLTLTKAKNVSLVGEPGARLVMAPEVCVAAAADAPKGQGFVEVEPAAGLTEGMGLEIQANGLLDTTPSGQKYQRPFFGTTVVAVEGNKIKVRRPLDYAVPTGTKIVYAYNAITLSGTASNITIQGLEIDLNRDKWPLRPINHTSHCAVFGAGAYDHTKGMAGASIEGVVIRNCVLRNCHHRGVAWYSVVRSSVVGCRIEDTGAEAIDFDHFCFNCEARDNDIRNAPSGVELNDASDCIVENNRIDGCERGIIVWRWFAGDHLNTGNIFRSNQITNSKKVGIACEPRTSKTMITANTIQGSGGTGIQLGGDENTVEQNTVRGCAKEGIFVSGNRNVSHGNDLKENRAPMKDTGKENQVQ
jgi:parallel beta-helix repeat protein